MAVKDKVEHTWVKFTQDFIQKGKDEDKDKTFTKGNVIQLDEEVAKQLTELGIVEETDAPELDNEVAKSLASLEENLSSIIDKTIAKAINNAQGSVKKKLDAIPKGENSDLESQFGWKEPDHFFKAVRAAVIPEIAPTFPGIEFLSKAPTGQNTLNDTEGGFAVPDIISSGIWDNIGEDPANIFSMATRFTTAGNSMKVHRYFEASRKSGKGNRHGGVLTVWLDEADEITATKGTSGKLTLELHKLAAVIYATEEQMDDQGFDFFGFVKRQVPRALNFEIGLAMILGTGVAKPKGVLKGDSLIIVPLENGQDNHTILHNNIRKMYNRQINPFKASWFVHRDLMSELEIMFFNDDSTNKRPVYLPANQLVDAPFGVLYGRPVIPLEYMPDFGDVGDIAFLDWSQYAVLTKAGQKIKTASSIHVRFLFEETAFRFSTRIDGRELWSSPKEDLHGDTTRSPFVTLASRTGGGTSSGL